MITLNFCGLLRKAELYYTYLFPVLRMSFSSSTNRAKSPFGVSKIIALLTFACMYFISFIFPFEMNNLKKHLSLSHNTYLKSRIDLNHGE